MRALVAHADDNSAIGMLCSAASVHDSMLPERTNDIDLRGGKYDWTLMNHYPFAVCGWLLK